MHKRLVVKTEYFTRKEAVVLQVISITLILMCGFVAGILAVLANERDWKISSTEKVALAIPPVRIPAPDIALIPMEGADMFVLRPPAEVFLAELATEYSPADHNKELQCMAKNIYFEARNESLKGQIAVALVTINRVMSHKYPDNICDVVWEKRIHPITKKWVAQFSWTLDGLHDVPKEGRAWKRSLELAGAMLAEGQLNNFYDFTEGADHYHAHYVNPYWSERLEKVAVIDTHIFYK